MITVLGLTLPLAGSPLYYCLCANTLLLAGKPGCACEVEPAAADCCEGQQPQHPAPSQPDCMVSLKVLPDALLQADLALPAPLVADLPPAVFAAPAALLALLFADPLPHDRGPPPVGPPIYLRDRSLLL